MNADRSEGGASDLQPARKGWSRRAQLIASIVWPSFMVAVVSSLLFFSLVDAQLLGLAMLPEREFSALTGYGATFFFFWLVALASSWITVYLRRTSADRLEQIQKMSGDK